MNLAERVKVLTGCTSEIHLVPYEVAYETGCEDMQRRRPDISRIGETTGWQPTRGLDQILEDVMVDLRDRPEL